ncbi:MAG: 2TM domain-containing protein [Bacteroidota bacterium]|nr:2TM domain-containing protein [Bacteroidota bacterium]
MENVSQSSYERAKKRVCLLKAFYNSLFAYCIIIPILVYINYRTTSFPWAIFPAVGWGMGLIGMWLSASGRNPLFGKDWEERKIKEFMNSDNF